jgi:hypothetical protein
MRTQNRFLKVEKNLLAFLNSESSVVYILNGGILKENFEGELSFVDNKSLIELTVFGAEKLKKDFGIDKKFGVLIKANVKEKKDAKKSI